MRLTKEQEIFKIACEKKAIIMSNEALRRHWATNFKIKKESGLTSYNTLPGFIVNEITKTLINKN